MNNNRRKELYDIQKELDNIKDKIACVIDDEQWCFDSMPENLQYSMRGEAMEEAIDNMNEAMEAIDEAINRIDDAAI